MYQAAIELCKKYNISFAADQKVKGVSTGIVQQIDSRMNLALSLRPYSAQTFKMACEQYGIHLIAVRRCDRNGKKRIYYNISTGNNHIIRLQDLPCMTQPIQRILNRNYKNRQEKKRFVAATVKAALHVMKLKLGDTLPQQLAELDALLQPSGVRVITHSNSGGIYGVSFTCNEYDFKGSEIKCSLQSLKSQFSNLAAITPVTVQRPSSPTSPLYIGVTSSSSHSDEEEDERRRKRKKVENRGL